MGQLFGTNRQAITKRIRNIYDTGELNREATSSILELVQTEGNRKVRRKVEYCGHSLNALGGKMSAITLMGKSPDDILAEVQ